jgi:uncharacterized protein (DUF58 family)
VKKLLSVRFGYFISLGFALAASAMFGGVIAYGMAAALVLLPAAALLLAWLSERQLNVRHALDSERCYRESDVRYAIQIRNKGLVPVTWAAVKCSMEEPFEVSLEPLGRFRHLTGFTPPHRGLYTLTVDSVRVSDPFRLAKLGGRRPDPLTLMVMPKLVPISEAWKQRLDPQGVGGIFSQSSDEPAVDNRVYRYGDSPRRIHWNLTARRRELMVRQYESIESRRLLVVLDLSAFEADEPKKCEDTLIEACLSVISYALERQIETTLAYAEGDAIRRHTGRDARIFDEIHHAMAKVEFSARVPVLHLLEEAKRAQMVYLFCMEAPDGGTLSALPQDKPVELAVMRTRGVSAPLPSSVESVHVTELVP